MGKLPAILFYIGDWRKDLAVQSLPYESRGMWFELLLFMHESDTRGALVLNGRAMTDQEISSLLRITESKWSKTKQTLLGRGVASLKQVGSKGKALVNRRMYRKYLEERTLSKKRADAGRAGGSKPEANHKAKGLSKPEAKQPSSSSSASSSASSSSVSSSASREGEGEPAPDGGVLRSGSIEAQLAATYLRSNPGVISQKKAADLIRFNLKAGMNAKAAEVALFSCAGRKLWDVLDPITPNGKRGETAAEWRSPEEKAKS